MHQDGNLVLHTQKLIVSQIIRLYNKYELLKAFKC